ncbi:MMPL family transporter [Pseudoalteromonas sp. SMS1]|uniref:efflux RND transporter permease subunit n=1 Tax=Pseudoalteromonas sp. SMS1 TaxID=2908894 RepID=UPI001F1FC21C|nr:MMPL family transporter [Pseudoalteromonas sp. SMS1]MCF2858940.1 MMPL family transporter [Pseudoalteromonas sp. SMS1]
MQNESTMNQELAYRVAQFFVAKRKILALMSLVLFAVTLLGFQNFKISSDYKSFFYDDDPNMIVFNKLQDTFNKSDNIFIAIRPKQGDVFTPEVLKVIEQITEESWLVPFSKRVDSIVNYQYTWVDGDDLLVQGLFDSPAQLSASDIEKRRQIALQQPEILHKIINADGTVTGINITTELPGLSKTTEVPEAVGFVREMVAKYEQSHPNIELYLAGSNMLSMAHPEASKENNKLYVVMLLVILTILFLIYRSFNASFITLVVILLSALSGIAFIAAFDVTFTAIGTSGPIMILALTVAHCIHLIQGYCNQLKLTTSNEQALINSLTMNIKPIILASATTIIGFMTLNFSATPPFGVLGNVVSAGIAYSVIFVFCLLPFLLLLFKNTKVKGGNVVNMGAFADFLIAKKKPVFALSALVSVTLSAFLLKNIINDNNFNHFDETTEYRQNIDFVDQHITGVKTIYYKIAAEHAYGVVDPEYMRTLEGLAQWIRAQPGVVHVASFTDIMKRLNQNMNGGDPALYTLPEDKTLASQYLLLYELSLPYGLGLNNMVDMEQSATKLTVSINKLSDVEVFKLEEGIRSWLQQNAPEHMWTKGTGQNMMFIYVQKSNIESLLKGVFTGLALISLILVVTFRSIKIGLLSLIPNILPALIAFGIWGIFVGEVGLALSMVMGMTMGIVVDDTVHFLSKYLQARRQGQNAEAAVKYSFLHSGEAIVITTIVLCIGFLVLCISPFTLSADMGLMCALTIFIALLTDLLLLPTLLMLFDRDKEAATSDSKAEGELAS